MWTFLACPAPGGGRPLDRFLDELDVEAEANFSATLELLQVMDRRYWVRPQFDTLHCINYQGMGRLGLMETRKPIGSLPFLAPQDFNSPCSPVTSRSGT